MPDALRMRGAVLRAAALTILCAPGACVARPHSAPRPAAAVSAADSAIIDFAAAARRARASERADAGATWGVRLDTVPLLGVLDGHVVATADPGQPGYVEGPPGFWRGALPEGIAPSNTSVDWAGRRWAMVILPLPYPGDPTVATRLLIHEAFHVVEPTVVDVARYDETDPAAEILDRPAGRIWLQLEWRALAAALDSTGAARERSIHRALLFRARRYALAQPAERARERLLDLKEGLAEYTAWRLTGGDEAALARVIRTQAPALSSYLRAFPYFTGPAYGLLLDDLAPGWRARLDSVPDLQRLLATATGDTTALAYLDGSEGRATPLAAAADSAAGPLGLGALSAQESLRWDDLLRRQAAARQAFVDGPTLRLRPGSLSISFNPQQQLALGDAGTVMGRVVWRGPAGAELDAPAGALVSHDWTELRVPLGDARLTAGPLASPLHLTGKGWTLSLPAGWVVTADGDSRVLTPPGQ